MSTWKKLLIDGAVQLFESGRTKAIDKAALTSPLYEEIGRLKVELDWLKKKLASKSYNEAVSLHSGFDFVCEPFIQYMV